MFNQSNFLQDLAHLWERDENSIAHYCSFELAKRMRVLLDNMVEKLNEFLCINLLAFCGYELLHLVWNSSFISLQIWKSLQSIPIQLLLNFFILLWSSLRLGPSKRVFPLFRRFELRYAIKKTQVGLNLCHCISAPTSHSRALFSHLFAK